MLLDDLKANKQAIEQLAQAHGAVNLRIFGSVSRGEERPDSDLDVLVDLPHGYDLFAQRLALTEKLSELTGRKVDLVPEHELNRHIKSSILNEAIRL